MPPRSTASPDCLLPVHRVPSYQSTDHQSRETEKIDVPNPLSHTQKQSLWTFSTGLLLSTLSGVLFTTNNFIIKQFKVVPSDAILVRGLLQVTILFGISRIRSYRVFPATKRSAFLIWTQGVFGGFAFISALISVSFMPVADALVVMFSDPLVTMVVASIFLGERFNIIRVLTGSLILAGVTFVCRPPFLFGSMEKEDDNGVNTINSDAVLAEMNFTLTNMYEYTSENKIDTAHDRNYFVGVAFAIAAVLTGCFHNIVVPLCQEIESTVLVMWVGIAAIAISSVSAQFDASAQIATGHISEIGLEMWLIMLGLAISGMFAYIFLTKSLQMISPTLVSSMRSLEIIFAYAVESILFNTPPSLMSSIGALLVILGVVGIACEEKLLSLFARLRRPAEYEEI